MSIVTICDTECNSLDTVNGFIMELAWGKYDTHKKRFLETRSSFIKWSMPYDVNPEAAEITGLTYEFCEGNGNSAQHELGIFLNDAQDSEYVIGHNYIGYDKLMLASNLQRAWPGIARKEFEKLPVIDTLLDCPFPKRIKSKSLKYLAIDHNYILMGAHQAINDVFACAHILSCYDFDQLKASAATPVVILTSKIDYWEKDKKEELRQQGFYWNPNRKLWEKRIREYFLPNIQLNFEFNREISP